MMRIKAVAAFFSFLGIVSLAHGFGIEAFNNCQLFKDQQIKMMTYNMQINSQFIEVAPWDQRVNLISKLLNSEKTDIIGAQEITPSMLPDLLEKLPNHDYVGVARGDGAHRGEYNPIFYIKNHFDLLDSGTFWLSTQPEKPGSIGWDASVARIVTWAFFRDRRHGQEFYVFNTHFDHKGLKARLESVRLLAARVKKISAALPSVVMGDFNFETSGPEYPEFLKLSSLFDAMKAGPHQGVNWTFSFLGFRRMKIDYVFTPRDVQVCQHQIISEKPNSYKRSDHLPIQVNLLIP